MSNETVKNKLVNSMRMTKAGTSKSDDTAEQKSASANKTEKPKKADTSSKKSSPSASGYTLSGCRVWPD